MEKIMNFESSTQSRFFKNTDPLLCCVFDPFLQYEELRKLLLYSGYYELCIICTYISSLPWKNMKTDKFGF